MEQLVHNHKHDIVNTTSDTETKCNTLSLYNVQTFRLQIKQMHKTIITK